MRLCEVTRSVGVQVTCFNLTSAWTVVLACRLLGSSSSATPVPLTSARSAVRSCPPLFVDVSHALFKINYAHMCSGTGTLVEKGLCDELLLQAGIPR